MNHIYIFLIVLLVSTFNYSQSNVINENGTYYFSDRLVIKYKEAPNKINKRTQDLFERLGIMENKPSYNFLKDRSRTSEELHKIYSVRFSLPYNPIYIAKELSKMKDIEWAEPHYLYELAFEPNDPFFADSTNNNFEMLNVIKAGAAWNINTGSEEVIIAIIDTGVDWNHEDLSDNIWTNSEEIPENGIDDDGNGFIDDIRGWDFGGLDGTPDNDPDEDRADHGTHVAGLASAVTNNNIGIASIGYKSKIMPVKTSQDDIRSGSTALIAYGFDGILYAADNGANIINCSWGGYSYSFAAQEIIDYAVSKGALVVGAAGNDNTTNHFYPASYDGVLSVAGTNYVDQKASWSNYGTKVDVTSPGVSIYSTWPDNSYTLLHGTSMASPIAAGLAALVKAEFPDFNPLQVGEQIRANTDNIGNVNLGYLNQLGSGRINAEKALFNIYSKSVRISEAELFEVGDGDGIFESGENVKIKLELTNYLYPVSNLNLTLSTGDPNIEFVKSSLTIGSMNMMDVIETDPELLEIAIKQNAEQNIDINILVTFSGDVYNDQDWITLSINPTYQIQTTENISVTFSSSGSIGFDDYPTNLKGKGLIYKDGSNLMFEGALIYGNSANTIVNSARDVNGDKDLDFSIITPISQISPGEIADKETYTKFSDASASPLGLGIETEVFTYSFSGLEDADYILMRYSFTNTTSERINDFHVGQYWDFDMDGSSFEDDMVAFDTENNFGYAFDDDGNPVSTYIGLAMLSDDNTSFFAMDNTGDSNPTISWDGFSDSEKWTALTSGKNFLSSGPSDISLMISGGPYTINPNSKIDVDFVIAAADDLPILRNVIEKARNKYSELPTDIEIDENLFAKFNLEQNYPNPFNPSTKIKYTIPSDGNITQNVKLVIYDILGRELVTLVNKEQNPGNYEIEWNARNYSSGVYFYKLTSGRFVQLKKMTLLK